MANIVKILWSKITGHVPSSLQDGQIAINQLDKKLFYPNENGTIQTFNLIPSAGGSPAGANTQIQYNDNGSFGASAGLTYNPITGTLGLEGVDPEILMNGITTEPSVPASGKMIFYPKYISGKASLKLKGASGLDYVLQAAFWGNNISIWCTTSATAGLWIGTIGAGAGTFVNTLPTVTSVYTSIKRARYANVVTTLNQVLGQRNTEARFFRGSLPGQGGFFFFARMGFDIWTNGARFFGGMHSATTVVSADPSALNNTVGFCIDSDDAGVISFLTRGTVATKASTGFTAVTGKGYDIYAFCAPNSTQISWRIVDINTGIEANGIATLNLPTNTVMLTAGVLASNAALTPVTSVAIGINRIYIETDY